MSDQPESRMKIGQPTSGPQVYPRSGNWQAIFVNGFTFQFTATDFGITLLTPVPGPNAQTLHEQAVTANMSLSFLKLLSEHLSTIVRIYEEDLGKIKVSSTMRPNDAQIAAIHQIIQQAKLAD